MTRREYLSSRLKQDFIKYVILQSPRFSDSEVSAKLKRLIDSDTVYRGMKEVLATVLDRHLSIDRLKDKNGAYVKVLPDWLSPDLANVIAKDFRQIISEKFDCQSFISAIIRLVEKLVWPQGLENLANDLKVFITSLENESRQYAGMPSDLHPDYEIQAKYDAAKHISITERFTGDNDDDILVFRTSLLAHAQTLCQNEIYTHLSKLYSAIARSHELELIISSFDKSCGYAKCLMESYVEPEREEAWAEEYDRLVPVDFFKRNIEDVTDAMAFHMILLQAFSRNESYLRENNYLTLNGELRLFTSAAFNGADWTNIDFYRLVD